MAWGITVPQEVKLKSARGVTESACNAQDIIVVPEGVIISRE